MVKKSNIRFSQFRAFFEGMGFSATREKKGCPRTPPTMLYLLPSQPRTEYHIY